MMSDQWTILPLWLATGSVDKSMTLLYRDQGIKEEGPVLAWLLKSKNAKVLVDNRYRESFQKDRSVFYSSSRTDIGGPTESIRDNKG